MLRVVSGCPPNRFPQRTFVEDSMQRRKMLSGGPVLAIVAGVILSFAPMATAQSDNSANQIEGTWRVQITFVNCDTDAPTGQVAQGMNTFIHGGTMVGTPSAPSVVIRNG